QLPAGQFRGQADVLTATADGLSQGGFVFDGDVHGVAFFIDHDGGDFGRLHGVDHQLRRVVVPQHDVDALTGQFVGHGLHTRAAHTDAGTDRVDALVVGFHGDLGAGAGVTGSALDFDQLFANFRHFDLEQFDQHFRRGAAGKQLRATVFR